MFDNDARAFQKKHQLGNSFNLRASVAYDDRKKSWFTGPLQINYFHPSNEKQSNKISRRKAQQPSRRDLYSKNFDGWNNFPYLTDKHLHASDYFSPDESYHHGPGVADGTEAQRRLHGLRWVTEPPAQLTFINSTGGSLSCQAVSADGSAVSVQWIHEDGRPVTEVSRALLPE